MGDTLGQAGDPFAEGGEVPAEIPDLLAHVSQVGPEPSGQGDDQGGREPRKKGFHVPNSSALLARRPARSCTPHSMDCQRSARQQLR